MGYLTYIGKTHIILITLSSSLWARRVKLVFIIQHQALGYDADAICVF